MQNMLKSIITGFLAILIAVGMITGCGSSGGGNNNVEPQKTVSGVAASGAPMAGTVYVKGANGEVRSAGIATDGSYILDITGLPLPYILKAEGTVKGRSLSIYSAGLTDGTINITPVTDFILRNALKAQAEAAYNAWSAGSLTQAKLDEAESAVKQQLAPVLAAMDVQAGQADLITTAFAADGQGLDGVLDALDIQYTGTMATVKNLYTTHSYTQDIAASSFSTGFSTSETAETRTLAADNKAIQSLFDSMVSLYKTSKPSEQSLTAWFNAHVTEDFLDEGRGRSDMLEEWIDEGPQVGCDIQISILGTTTAAGYDRAYLIGITYSDGNETDYNEEKVVFKGSSCLWHGDGKWAECELSTSATLDIKASGAVTSYVVLEIDGSSGTGYAHNHGVRSFFVTGPGLPDGGVIFQDNYPDDNEFDMYGSGAEHVNLVSDAVISAIPDNAVYTFSFCSDTASSLNDNGTASGHVLQVYTETLKKRPLLYSEINTSLFPSLTSPTGHILSSLGFGTEKTVTWTQPANTKIDGVALIYAIGGTWYDVEDDGETGTTSAVLDLRGIVTPPDWAVMEIEIRDVYDRGRRLLWYYQ